MLTFTQDALDNPPKVMFPCMCLSLSNTHTHTLLKGCIKRLALHLTSTLQPQYGLVIKTVIHRHLVFDNL